MGIVDGRAPSPAEPEARRRRVVVKFRNVSLREMHVMLDPMRERLGEHWEALARTYPGIALRPYFSTLDERTRVRLSDASSSRPGSEGLGAYYALEIPRGADARSVADRVASWPGVVSAYVEGGPTPPPVHHQDDPRNPNQGYQDPRPKGVDARWAWSHSDGAGVGFVDLEQGWLLDHEDLAAARITIISGVNHAFPGHGAAVLGEVVGVDNDVGGVGIAPSASTRVVSQWRTADDYNTAEAILSAAADMAAGDVLLLEAQTPHPDHPDTYVPVEVEDAVFEAIDRATREFKLVVLEAAGNGNNVVGVDLDKEFPTLNRAHPRFRDSGAVLVGAASAAAPHSRLGFSNYGSRIDCFAWGERVDTCGDGWEGKNPKQYTTGFGGTSSATPIVTGAALLLQSLRVRKGLPRYAPAALRALLSDHKLNTASKTPAADRIGVMPDLRALVAHEYPTRPGSGATAGSGEHVSAPRKEA